MTISSSDPLLSQTSSWDSPLSPALPTSLFGALLRHRSGVSAWDRGAGDCINLSLERHEVALELLVFLIQPLNSGECDAIGVEFSDAMLSWPPGPRDTDGIWAKYWYAEVEHSTGFQPYRDRKIEVPERLREVHARCRECYEQLYKMRLR